MTEEKLRIGSIIELSELEYELSEEKNKEYGLNSFRGKILSLQGRKQIVVRGIVETEEGALITGPQDLFFGFTSQRSRDSPYWYALYRIRHFSEDALEGDKEAQRIRPYITKVNDGRNIILDFEKAFSLIPYVLRRWAKEVYERAKEVGKPKFDTTKREISDLFEQSETGLVNLFNFISQTGYKGSQIVMDDAAISLTEESELLYLPFDISCKCLIHFNMLLFYMTKKIVIFRDL
jgi:hypothetical protein